MVPLYGGVDGVEQAKPFLVWNQVPDVRVLVRAIIDLMAAWAAEFHYQGFVVDGQRCWSVARRP